MLEARPPHQHALGAQHVRLLGKVEQYSTGVDSHRSDRTSSRHAYQNAPNSTSFKECSSSQRFGSRRQNCAQ